jgi:hypothetical protein
MGRQSFHPGNISIILLLYTQGVVASKCFLWARTISGGGRCQDLTRVSLTEEEEGAKSKEEEGRKKSSTTKMRRYRLNVMDG